MWSGWIKAKARLGEGLESSYQSRKISIWAIEAVLGKKYGNWKIKKKGPWAINSRS